MGFRHATPLKQRGSAIVFAMGLSLLVVALSTALLLWLGLDIRRVEKLGSASERLGLIEYAEAMAAEKIKSLPEDWDKVWEIDAENATVSAQLEDLSGRLNINTVFIQDKPKDTTDFFQPKAVMARLLETASVQNGEELLDQFIAAQVIVHGVSQVPEFEAAAHYLYAAHPDLQQINLNTTTPEVFASVLGISSGQASTILANKPFKDTKEIHAALEQQELQGDLPSVDAWLGTEGFYYMLETTIKQKRSVRIYSFFQKKGEIVTLQMRSWEKMP